MKVYSYNRQEAIKNNCYKKITAYEKLKSISLLMLISVFSLAISFLIFIIGILLELEVLEYLGLILVPICFIITVFIIPIKYSNEYNKCSVWLYRAIIKDEKNKIWLVEQNISEIISLPYINEKDEFYKIFKKEKAGTVTELKNLKMLKENKKYYICTYQDVNDEIKTIEIVKAYKNLKEVL